MLTMWCYSNFIVLDIFQKLINAFYGSGVWGFTQVIGFFSTNVDGFFFLIWLFLLSSIFLNWASNPIYRIVNLAVISLLMVFMWGYTLDFTFILLCYVIAFTSAVVMLFLSVVLMLPASTVGGGFIQNQNMCLVYISLLSSGIFNTNLFNLRTCVAILADLLVVLVFLAGVFLLLYCLNKTPTLLKSTNAERSDLYQMPYKNLSFLAVLHTSPRWDFFEIREPYKLFKLFFKNYINENRSLGLMVGEWPELSGIWPPFCQSSYSVSGPRLYFVRHKVEAGRFVVIFFFELFWFLLTVIDFFTTSTRRHLGICCFFKTLKSWFVHDWVSSVISRLELLYLEAHEVWQSQKVTYPGKHSGWDIPVVFIERQKFVVVRILAWWSPFRVLHIFKLWSVADLTTLKNSMVSCADALIQGAFVILLFITITPRDFKFFYTPRGISNAEGAKVVNFDSLVELKHLLYEDMPLFIFVSVILLLIALLSVSVLKKK